MEPSDHQAEYGCRRDTIDIPLLQLYRRCEHLSFPRKNVRILAKPVHSRRHGLARVHQRGFKLNYHVSVSPLRSVAAVSDQVITVGAAHLSICSAISLQTLILQVKTRARESALDAVAAASSVIDDQRHASHAHQLSWIGRLSGHTGIVHPR